MLRKITISLILLTTFVQCQKRIDPQSILLHIEQTFVPDSRVGVFQIQAKVKASKIYLTGETDNKPAHQALIGTLKAEGYDIADNIIILPGKTNLPWALVSISAANMRISPSHDAEMTTQALMGTPLKILKEQDDWVWVQTPDKYLSWCEKDVIKLCSDNEFSQWQNSRRVMMLSWFDFLRDSATNNIVSDVIAGCILQYSSESNDAVVLRLPDGRKGKISKKSVTDFDRWKQQNALEADRLLETAKVFMGTPYLWGGASIKGVDCSGFVKSVYYLNGYIIARDASQQVNYGLDVPVEKNYESLRPGDLVFFGRPAREGKQARYTHVGMYSGDSEFIHASGRVKINSFDSTRVNYSHYRTINLLKARRIIGAVDSTHIVSIKKHPWY